jgi:hypothetical protein
MAVIYCHLLLQHDSNITSFIARGFHWHLFFRLEIYGTAARHVETTAVSPASQFDFLQHSSVTKC